MPNSTLSTRRVKAAGQLSKAEAIAEIKSLHEDLCFAAQISLEKAMRIGQVLSAQKEKLPHGKWEDFVLAELPFTVRTASNYMRVARHLKSETISDLPLTAAYRLLTEPKHKPQTKPAQRESEQEDPPRVVAHVEVMTPELDPPTSPTPSEGTERIIDAPALETFKRAMLGQGAAKKWWFKSASPKRRGEFIDLLMVISGRVSVPSKARLRQRFEQWMELHVTEEAAR